MAKTTKKPKTKQGDFDKLIKAVVAVPKPVKK